MAMQNLIFRFLQSRQKVQIWLYEQTDLRIEGRIIVRRSNAPPPSPRPRAGGPRRNRRSIPAPDMMLRLTYCV